MADLLDYTPIAAAAFAIPQFLPQLLKLRATDDTAGVSWSWATLTSVNNAAWFAYFAVSGYWTALVPAASATLLAGALATMLAAHPGRAVLLDDLRPPPARPTPDHPRRHRCHRKRAHACPDPPHTPTRTAQQGRRTLPDF
jgi:uncharacterized protein with PQ loop repeat